MTGWRRAVRIGVGAGIFVAGVGLVAGLAAVAAMGTEGGRRVLADALADILGQPGVAEVAIGRLGPGLPGRITADAVTVSDARGVWLRFDGLDLAWSPLAVLAGRIDVRSLSVARIRVERAPTTDGAAEDSPEGVPALPVDVRVERLTVDEASLGESVLGAPVAVRISGRLAGQGGVIDASVDVERTDGIAGRATLAATFEPRAATLRLEARAEEPACGVIARALDLAPYPPVSMALEGAGPLDGWRGTLTVVAEKLARIEARLSVAPGDARPVRIEGRADVGGLLDSTFRPVVADGIAFAAVAGPGTGNAIWIREILLMTAAWSVRGDARIGLDAFDVDARLRLVLTDSAPLAALIAPVALGDATADLAVAGPLAGPGLAVRGSGALEDLRLDDAALTAVLGGRIAWSVDGTVELDPLAFAALRIDAANGTIAATAAGSLGFDDGTLDASVRAEIDDIAGLAPVVGRGLGGRATVDGFFSGSIGGDLAGKLAGTVTDLATGDALVESLIGREVGFGADVAVTADRGVRIDALSFDGGAVRGEGTATLPPALDAVTATYRVEVADLAGVSTPLGAALSGSAVADGEIRGPMDGPGISGRLTSAGLAIEGVSIETASAAFALGPTLEHLALTEIAATVSDVPIAGTVDVDLVTGLATGRLDAVLPPAGAGIGGWRLAGVLRGTVELAGTNGVQTVAVEAAGGPVSLTPADGGEIAAASLTLIGRVTDPVGTPQVSARLQATTVEADGMSVGTLSATADGPLARAEIAVEADRIAGDAAALAGAGRVTLAGARTEVVVERLRGRLAGHPVRLGAPMRIAAGPGSVAVEGLALEIGDGRLSGRGRRTADGTDADVVVDRLPLDLARLVLGGERIGGTLSGRAIVTSGADRLTGSVEVSVEGASYGADGDSVVPAIDGAFSARADGVGVDVEARVLGLLGHDVTAVGRVPVAIDTRSLAPVIDRAAPVSARLDWTGDVGPLWELLPLDAHRLTGTGRLALTATGNLDAPRLGGSVSISGGTYEHLVVGTLVTDLDLDIAPQADGTVGIALSGTDGDEGQIAGSGTLPMELESDAPVSFVIEFDGMTVVRRDEVAASAGGRIDYRGTVSEGRIGGEVTTELVEARLVDRLPPSVVTLDVTEVGGSGTTTRQADSEDEPPGWSGDLGITVAMPQRVFVRGRGLESEWSGTIGVSGPADAPRIEGTMTLMRGHFTFADKRFALTKGVVAFDGAPESDPSLDIVAERETGGITAVIAIGGRASALSIDIGSRPALPRDEVVARVLFGKSVAQMSALEAAQLAAAVSSLSGEGGIGGDIFAFARNMLGVDVLTVDPGASEGESPSVGVGRYVGDRTYVGIKQGADLQSGSATVEVEVTPNVSIESDIGQDASGSLGVQWKWNY